MASVIKRVTADPTQADRYYNGTPSPSVWSPLITDASTYTTPYLALSDAAAIHDAQDTYPEISGTDRVVIWDEGTGREYPIRGLLVV